MTSPLQGSLAAKIGAAFASTFYAAAVNVTTNAASDPETSWIPGASTTVAHSCLGMVDEFSAYYLANGLVQANDRRVLILATSLDVTPTEAMTVTIRGATYQIVKVVTDPALAVWELQVRV
jgi:hypothetical protein